MKQKINLDQLWTFKKTINKNVFTTLSKKYRRNVTSVLLADGGSQTQTFIASLQGVNDNLFNLQLRMAHISVIADWNLLINFMFVCFFVIFFLFFSVLNFRMHSHWPYNHLHILSGYIFILEFLENLEKYLFVADGSKRVMNGCQHEKLRHVNYYERLTDNICKYIPHN